MYEDLFKSIDMDIFIGCTVWKTLCMIEGQNCFYEGG